MRKIMGCLLLLAAACGEGSDLELKPIALPAQPPLPAQYGVSLHSGPFWWIEAGWRSDKGPYAFVLYPGI